MSDPIEISETMPELAEALQPQRNDEPIQTEIAASGARAITADEGKVVATKLGLVRFNSRDVKRLAAIGISAEKLGVSKITRGAILFTLDNAMYATSKAREVLENAKDDETKLAAAACMGGLIKSTAGLLAASSLEEIVKQDGEEKRFRRAAVAKGAPMGPKPVAVTRVTDVIPKAIQILPPPPDDSAPKSDLW